MVRSIAYIINLILLTSVLGCSKKSSTGIDGFRVISLPRSSVQLGAIWVNGKGPDGSRSVSIPIDSSQSYSSIQFKKSFKKELDNTFLQFLNLQKTFKIGRDVEFDFEGISIHQVGDIYSLDIREGEYYVMQAIKIRSIEIKVSNLDKLKLKSKINLPGNSKIIESNSMNSIKISGMNLFVAFDIMSFKMKQADTLGMIDLFNKLDTMNYFAELSSIDTDIDGEILKLNDQYEVKIDMSEVKNNCNQQGEIWCLDTRYKIEVTDFGSLDKNRRPKMFIFSKKYFDKDRENIYALATRKTTNEILADRLVTSRIRYEKIDSSYFNRLGFISPNMTFENSRYLVGEIYIIRSALRVFRPDERITAPGWID